MLRHCDLVDPVTYDEQSNGRRIAIASKSNRNRCIITALCSLCPKRCCSSVEFAVPVSERGRLHERAFAVFVCLPRRSPNLEWWCRSIPVDRLAVVYADRLVPDSGPRMMCLTSELCRETWPKCFILRDVTPSRCNKLQFLVVCFVYRAWYLHWPSASATGGGSYLAPRFFAFVGCKMYLARPLWSTFYPSKTMRFVIIWKHIEILFILLYQIAFQFL